MANHTDNSPKNAASASTGVFALLKAKPGVTRDQIMPIMPAEIRATVKLYLEGRIREWHGREDGKGAIFLVNAKSVEEAKAIIEDLPLSKEHLLDHEYIAVSPLGALRLLLGPQIPSSS